MCLYLYIHNKYTQYTLIYYVNKNLFWMQLITINRLTALIICICIYIYIYIYVYNILQILYIVHSFFLRIMKRLDNAVIKEYELLI